MRFISLSGFSWWEVLYRDGRTVGEWDSVLEDRRRVRAPRRDLAGSSRWEEVDHKALVGLRLIGPNGQVGDLRAARDHSAFQFKIGVAQLVGIDDQRITGHHRQAHVIGVVRDPPLGKEAGLGTCVCYAWEHEDAQGIRLEPPGRMVGPFVDNVLDFQFHKVGPLGLDNLSLKL